MASRYAPSRVFAQTSKGETAQQTHSQTVTQAKGTTTKYPGETTTTTHPSRTVTEQSSGLTTTSHGTKSDVKSQTVTEDAGFTIKFSIQIHGGLNAGGSSPALP